MDSAIICAIINAAASIAAAIIGAAGKGAAGRAVDSSRTKASLPLWMAAGTVVATWALVSPANVHVMLVHFNFALIPLAVMALTWFRPIQPMIAASVTLGLFAMNWIGWSAADGGSQASNVHLLAYLSLATISAVAAFLLSGWRRVPEKPPVRRTNGICTQLERLSDLHRAGELSEEEFAWVKERVLRRPVAHRTVQLLS